VRHCERGGAGGRELPAGAECANRLGINADNPKLWSETGYVRRLLKQYGIRLARAEMLFPSGEALPDRALLAVKWHKERDRTFWHWVAFWRGPYGRSCLTRSKHDVAMCAPTLVA